MQAFRVAILAVPLVLLAVLAPCPVEAAPTKVTVPDVVGRSVSSAQALVSRAGLTVRVIGPSSGEGRRMVTAQRPQGGAQVRAGAQVRLTFRWVRDGQAPPSGPDASRTVRVPRVIGLSPQVATNRLQQAGLGTRVVGSADEGRRRVVVSQNPTAGAVVKRGVVVRIVQRSVR